MARPFHPKVVTANRLIEGDVVYLNPNHDWVTDLQDALYITDETQANAMLATAQAQKNLVAGAYLADMILTDGIPAPAHFREAFRAKGPSNYPHGKQNDKQTESTK